MKKRLVFMALAALAVLLAACGGAAPTSTSAPTVIPTATYLLVSSAEGGFLVRSPVALTETSNIVTMDVGNLEVHTFQGIGDQMSYSVVYADYPEGYKTVDAGALLVKVRDEQVSSIGGTLVSQAQIKSSSVNGLEIRIGAEADGGQKVVFRSWLLWVPTRLYQVSVLAPEGRADDEAVVSFLESFELADRAD
jgi:hypothetical protein